MQKYKFEFDISFDYNGVAWEDWFGGAKTDSFNGYRFRRKNLTSTVGFCVGGSNTEDVSLSANVRHSISMDGNGNVTIDGNEYSLSPSSINFFSDVHLFLFAWSLDNTPYRIGNVKFYSFRCYDGDSLVLDLIPIRIGAVGYMYDLVTCQIFGNRGTGNFIVGPDVVEVEYLESTGT